jgi:hypothetical protein
VNIASHDEKAVVVVVTLATVVVITTVVPPSSSFVYEQKYPTNINASLLIYPMSFLKK